MFSLTKWAPNTDEPEASTVPAMLLSHTFNFDFDLTKSHANEISG